MTTGGEMKLAKSRSRIMLCIASALLMPSWHPSSALALAPPTPTRACTQRCQRQRQCQWHPLTSMMTATETSEAESTRSPTTTSNTSPNYEIGEAQYSDLAQAADLMTDGFYPELRNNPLLRPIRYLMELDRLQNNFPYDGKDGRHFYLVAYDCTETTAEGGRKVVGFCDIDGRIPKADTSNNNLLSTLSPFATNIRRPQPYFSDLSIDPNHRRKGIASSLMIEAERRAKDMGFTELYLGVRSTNKLALQMYSKIGYELIVPYGDMLAFLEVQKDVRMLRRSLE